ncbi:MAG TPA: RNA methyltransferase [Pseudobdellovibrionaceae bacterium]|nr:RNA methyltransferase [Pseudobdellovibrionaceae bacterium]
MASDPKLIKVSSTENPMWRSWKELLRHPAQEFLVHGQRFTREMAKRHPDALRALILREGAELDMAGRDLFSKRFEQKITRVELTPALFAELDPFGVPDMIGVFAAPELSPLVSNPKGLTNRELWLATQNPTNLGACLRSATAFGIQRIVLLAEAASPFHARAVRAAAGQVLNFEFSRGPSIDELASLPPDMINDLIALDLHGVSMQDFKWPQNFRLLIGEEGQGIPAKLPAQRLHIPMSNGLESLNAAVSCGIALYASRFSR